MAELTKEECDRLRDVGVAWVTEVEFERLLNTIESLRATLERVQEHALQRSQTAQQRAVQLLDTIDGLRADLERAKMERDDARAEVEMRFKDIGAIVEEKAVLRARLEATERERDVAFTKACDEKRAKQTAEARVRELEEALRPAQALLAHLVQDGAIDHPERYGDPGATLACIDRALAGQGNSPGKLEGSTPPVGILALRGQWPGDETDAEVEAALRDEDPREALLAEAAELPCYVARNGEGTYECGERLCEACDLRGRVRRVLAKGQ